MQCKEISWAVHVTCLIFKLLSSVIFADISAVYSSNIKQSALYGTSVKGSGTLPHLSRTLPLFANSALTLCLRTQDVHTPVHVIDCLVHLGVDGGLSIYKVVNAAEPGCS